jgi:tRNA(fMet)-specific endonuclease VapC
LSYATVTRAATGRPSPIGCRGVSCAGDPTLPFEAEDVAHAGDIRAHPESKGTPIGPYDYLIAAQARRRSAALVTLNVREFSRVPGLIVTDWAT